MSITAYKGFNADMTCRGFQYKEGETYTTSEAKLCKMGFHACENPLDCLQYYEPSQSVYHEVEIDGKVEKMCDGDTKVCASKITIGARLTIAGLIMAGVNYVLNKNKERNTTDYRDHAATTGNYAHAATTGNKSHAATTGYCAHATTTCKYAHAATTGDFANAVTTGNCANAVTTGSFSNAKVEGVESIAVVTGLRCSACGVIGSWIVLTERDAYSHVLGVKAVRIDGEAYKANTWYELKGGKIREVVL